MFLATKALNQQAAASDTWAGIIASVVSLWFVAVLLLVIVFP